MKGQHSGGGGGQTTFSRAALWGEISNKGYRMVSEGPGGGAAYFFPCCTATVTLHTVD